MSKIKNPELTQEFLQECFEYKNNTLWWKVRPEYHFKSNWAYQLWNQRPPGTKAGNVHKNGNWNVAVNARTLKYHRVVWILNYGEWPKCLIDPIDGNKANNSLDNLRLATKQENTMHRHKANRQNTCGVRGVTQNRKSGKYEAKICLAGKPVHLGCFETLSEAEAERIKAEKSTLVTFRGPGSNSL